MVWLEPTDVDQALVSLSAPRSGLRTDAGWPGVEEHHTAVHEDLPALVAEAHRQTWATGPGGRVRRPPLQRGDGIGGDGGRHVQWCGHYHLVLRDPFARVVGLHRYSGAARLDGAGDLALVAGRYIVDCGHPDFHTELHPVSFLAWAHRSGSTTVVHFYANGYCDTEYYNPIRPWSARSARPDACPTSRRSASRPSSSARWPA